MLWIEHSGFFPWVLKKWCTYVLSNWYKRIRGGLGFEVRTSDTRLAGRCLNHSGLLLRSAYWVLGYKWALWDLSDSRKLDNKLLYLLFDNVNTHDYVNLLLHDITQTSAAERHLWCQCQRMPKVLGHVFTIKLTWMKFLRLIGKRFSCKWDWCNPRSISTTLPTPNK